MAARQPSVFQSFCGFHRARSTILTRSRRSFTSLRDNIPGLSAWQFAVPQAIAKHKVSSSEELLKAAPTAHPARNESPDPTVEIASTCGGTPSTACSPSTTTAPAAPSDKITVFGPRARSSRAAATASSTLLILRCKIAAASSRLGLITSGEALRAWVSGSPLASRNTRQPASLAALMRSA